MDYIGFTVTLVYYLFGALIMESLIMSLDTILHYWLMVYLTFTPWLVFWSLYIYGFSPLSLLKSF